MYNISGRMYLKPLWFPPLPSPAHFRMLLLFDSPAPTMSISALRSLNGELFYACFDTASPPIRVASSPAAMNKSESSSMPFPLRTRSARLRLATTSLL